MTPDDPKPSRAPKAESSDTEKQLMTASMGGASKGLSEEHLSIALVRTGRIDQWMSSGSEWLSAILVKETRQALKSRQFVWTFFLLLIVIAVWAIFSITLASGDGMNPADLGPTMLAGFLVILGFPLAIIIPYSAFRSLAHEYENETLQMVSITTMKPYQIVAGKLGSALLQMMMYLSILAPCMAFTYLLRAVDVYQILFGMLVTVFGSICLCCICLFLGCGMRRRVIGIGMTVILIPALAFVYWLYCFFAIGLSYYPSFLAELESTEMQMVIYGWFAFAGSLAALAFVAATSQIAFDTENRSTRIRVALLCQQVLFIGFCIAMMGLAGYFETEMFWVVSFLYGHYWLVAGAVLISSTPIISRRVRRSFPKTLLGKLVFGLMMPGAGRAYLFAIGNLVGCMLTFLLLLVFHDYLIMRESTETQRIPFTRPLDMATAFSGLLVNLVFPIFFLSLTFLIVTLVKKRSANVPAIFGPLVAGFLVLAGYLFGIAVQYNFFRMYETEYTTWQSFYWYGTAADVYSGGSSSDGALGLILVGMATLVVGGVSFWIAKTDMAYKNLATPERVLKERQSRKAATPREPEETFEDLYK